MKKIIALIIIATMLIGVLSSCDVVDELIDKFGGEIGGTDDENQKYTITKEEWDALDNIVNYTINYTIISNISSGESVSNHIIYRSTETKRYERTTYRDASGIYLYEYYYCNEGDYPYTVTKNSEGNWYAFKSDWSSPSLLSQITFDSDTVSSFDDLVYDEESKSYVYTVVEDDFSGMISYHFKDGSLLSVDVEIMNIVGEAEYLDESIHMEIDFIDFTVIVIPDHIAPVE